MVIDHVFSMRTKLINALVSSFFARQGVSGIKLSFTIFSTHTRKTGNLEHKIQYIQYSD